MTTTMDDLHRNAVIFLGQFAETPILVHHMKDKRPCGPSFITAHTAKEEIGCNAVDKATDRLVKAGFFAQNLEAVFKSGQPSFIFGIAFGRTQEELETALKTVETDLKAFTDMVDAAGSAP